MGEYAEDRINYLQSTPSPKKLVAQGVYCPHEIPWDWCSYCRHGDSGVGVPGIREALTADTVEFVENIRSWPVRTICPLTLAQLQDGQRLTKRDKS